MEVKWRKFNPHGPNPQHYRMCLVAIAERADEGLPSAMAVGYTKRSGNLTYWIIPGVGGDVTHYSDCLGDDFKPIDWKMEQPPKKKEVEEEEPIVVSERCPDCDIQMVYDESIDDNVCLRCGSDGTEAWGYEGIDKCTTCGGTGKIKKDSIRGG